MPKLLNIRERRDDVVETVLEIVRCRGIEAVTMRAVAAQTGIAVSSLRWSFPTRERLLDLAIGHITEHHGDRYRRLLFAGKSSDAAFISGALLPLKDAEREHGRAWQVLSNLPYLSERSARLVAEDRVGRRALCRSVFARTREGGAAEADDAAVILLAVVDGLTLHFATARHRWIRPWQSAWSN